MIQHPINHLVEIDMINDSVDRHHQCHHTPDRKNQGRDETTDTRRHSIPDEAWDQRKTYTHFDRFTEWIRRVLTRWLVWPVIAMRSLQHKGFIGQENMAGFTLPVSTTLKTPLKNDRWRRIWSQWWRGFGTVFYLVPGNFHLETSKKTDLRFIKKDYGPLKLNANQD